MFKLLVSLIVVILTLTVVMLDPKMHKPVVIASKASLLETNALNTQDMKISPQNVEIHPEPAKTTPIENIELKADVQEEYMQGLKLRIQEQEKRYLARRGKKTKKESVIEQKPETIPQVTVEHPKENKNNALLPKSNELIVWNKWRADVCNTVANNSLNEQAYFLKKGIMFQYSFDVDNYRHITNVKVSFKNGTYNSAVKESLKDIRKTIMSLEGKNILAFPTGTKRETVHVEGGIEMADFDASVSPSNFSDIESVFK